MYTRACCDHYMRISACTCVCVCVRVFGLGDGGCACIWVGGWWMRVYLGWGLADAHVLGWRMVDARVGVRVCLCRVRMRGLVIPLTHLRCKGGKQHRIDLDHRRIHHRHARLFHILQRLLACCRCRSQGCLISYIHRDGWRR